MTPTSELSSVTAWAGHSNLREERWFGRRWLETNCGISMSSGGPKWKFRSIPQFGSELDAGIARDSATRPQLRNNDDPHV